MPTPATTMARLASALVDIDERDPETVDDFYVNVFPAFSEAIRQEIFGWLSSLDTEPSSEELEFFVAGLRERVDFLVQRTDIVSGSTREPIGGVGDQQNAINSMASFI